MKPVRPATWRQNTTMAWPICGEHVADRAALGLRRACPRGSRAHRPRPSAARAARGSGRLRRPAARRRARRRAGRAAGGRRRCRACRARPRRPALRRRAGARRASAWRRSAAWWASVQSPRRRSTAAASSPSSRPRPASLRLRFAHRALPGARLAVARRGGGNRRPESRCRRGGRSRRSWPSTARARVEIAPNTKAAAPGAAHAEDGVDRPCHSGRKPRARLDHGATSSSRRSPGSVICRITKRIACGWRAACSNIASTAATTGARSAPRPDVEAGSVCRFGLRGLPHKGLALARRRRTAAAGRRPAGWGHAAGTKERHAERAGLVQRRRRAHPPRRPRAAARPSAKR